MSSSERVIYVYECPSCGDQIEGLTINKFWTCNKCPSHDVRKLRYKKYADGTVEEVKEEESKGGCYVATACYDSYDAPEVLILRKYRDNILLSSFWGRLLVQVYYRVSPYIASKLKQKPRINSFIRIHVLDKIVRKLSR